MLCVMAVIYFLSGIPGDELILPDIYNLDKLLHAVVYAVLAASVIYGFLPLKKRFSDFIFGAGVVVFCMMYGISDEFHQSFVVNRSVSVWDVTADTVGALCAAAGWHIFGARD